MTQQDGVKKQLIDQLEKVNMRLQILDMIKNKLLGPRDKWKTIIELNRRSKACAYQSAKINFTI